MLDIKQVRQDSKAIAEALNKKYFTFDAAEFDALDASRKQADINSQNLLAERKKASKQVGELIKSGMSVDDAKAQVNETLAKIESELEALKQQAKDANDALDQLLMAVPNLPADEVPEGKDENCNVEVLRWGQPREFDFEVKDHVDVGESLGGLDFDTAAKITGSRFRLCAAGSLGCIGRLFNSCWILIPAPMATRKCMCPIWSMPSLCVAPGSCPNLKRIYLNCRAIPSTT